MVVLLAVMGYGCMRLEAVYTQRLARDFEGLGTASIGKDSEVADAMQSVWQDMQQEPADELVGGDGGRAVAGFPLPRTGRLAATEGDVLSIAGDDAAVADGNSVRVSGEIAEDLFGIAKGSFGVDDPVLAAGGHEGGVELSGIGEMGDAAMKFDFPACMGAGELLKEAAPEQAGEDLDRGQEGAASGLPLAGCDIEAGVRHDDMQMRMEAELLVPSVEDRGAADTQSTVTVVLGDGAQGLGGGAKQDVEHDLAVAKGDAEGWPAARLLATLAEIELAEREERRIRRYLGQSGLPGGKTLATFEFKAIPSLPRARIEALAAGDWLETGANLIAIGNSGAGKTHILCAIGHALVEAGNRVLYSRTTDLVQRLQAARKDLTLESALAKLDKFDLIILDDITYAQKDRAESSVLFELIARRYENRSLAIAANQPFSAWDRVFPDKAVTVAAVDRLVHHASILEMNVESYRRRAAQSQSKAPS